MINIRRCDEQINGVSNGGVMVTDKEVDLPGFFPVYHNPMFLMNIISFSDMRKRLKITVDTSKEAAMLVYIGNKKVMKFLEIGASLYTSKSEHNFNLLNKKLFVLFS